MSRRNRVIPRSQRIELAAGLRPPQPDPARAADPAELCYGWESMNLAERAAIRASIPAMWDGKCRLSADRVVKILQRAKIEPAPGGKPGPRGPRRRGRGKKFSASSTEHLQRKS